MKKLFSIILLSVFVLSLSACEFFTSETSFNLFQSGLLSVELKDKWGYVDEKGDEIIDFKYDYALPFHNDNAIVSLNNDVFVINKKGENILDDTYDNMTLDSEENVYFYQTNALWGLMDSQGKKLTEALFDSIFSFKDGLAKSAVDGSYGYLDTKGKTAIPLKYTYARDFSNGLAAVKLDDKYGYIDTKGKTVLDFIYDEAYSFDSFGRAVVSEEAEEYKLIDKDGKVILTARDIDGNDGPLYSVQENSTYMIYDKDGDMFYDKKFTSLWIRDQYIVRASYLENNYMNIWFNDDGTIFKEADASKSRIDFYPHYDDSTYLIEYDDDYINITSKKSSYRLKCDEVIQVLPKELFVVERDGKHGVVDQSGEVVIDFLYDQLLFFPDGYYLYMINDLIGLMDVKENIIFSNKYESVNLYYHYYH